MKAIITSVLSLCILSTFSCKKIEDKINNTVGDNDEGSLSAIIDGKTYTAPVVHANLSGSTLSFNGTDVSSDEDFYLSIDNYNATNQTYDFDFYHTTATYTDKESNSHRAATGQLTIESTGTTTAKGSFHFDTEDGMHVTEGKFDLNWE